MKNLNDSILHVLDLGIDICIGISNATSILLRIVLTKYRTATPDIAEFIDRIELRILISRIIDKRERLRGLKIQVNHCISVKKTDRQTEYGLFPNSL